jgi:hypothetical protein
MAEKGRKRLNKQVELKTKEIIIGHIFNFSRKQSVMKMKTPIYQNRLLKTRVGGNRKRNKILKCLSKRRRVNRK